jgi:hypothetical protein
MKLKLVGPRPANTPKGNYLFECEFEVVREDDHKALVGDVGNLRVLALNRVETAPPDRDWFERPLLVRAFGVAEKLKLGETSARISRSPGCQILAAAEPKDKPAKADADWFTKNLNDPISTPTLLLEQGRIRVGIPSSSALGKLLQIQPSLVAGEKGSILGSLPCKLDDSQLGAYLTPGGIEFVATVPVPGPRDESQMATLRLSWDSLLPGNYQLELVAIDKSEVNQVRDSLQAALRQLQGSPLEFDFNATLPVPPVSWPLENSKGRLQLLGAIPGAPGTWKAWRARLDGEAVRCRLRTSIAGAGGAESRLAEIRPTLVTLRKDSQLDGQYRLEAVTDSAAPNPPPELGRWAQHNGEWLDQPIVARTLPTSVFIDAKPIASRLLPLYQQKFAIEEGAEDPRYAFFVIDRGWLQWRFPARQPAQLPAGARKDPPQVLSGNVQIKIGNRSLQIEGATSVSIEAGWSSGINPVPDRISFKADKPQGSYSRFLFYAESSPTALDALPSLEAGAIATRDVPILFGDHLPRPEQSWLGTFTEQANGYTLELKTPGDSGLLWRRHVRMPLIPNMPLTNSSSAAGIPSLSRGLLPQEIVGSLRLAFRDGLPSASAELAWPKALEWPGHQLLRLTAPTLPGVEFVPDASGISLSAALRFDLPLLDELFATTSLPLKKNLVMAPTPPVIPSALQMEMLTAQVWVPNKEKLTLASVDAAAATPFVPVDQAPANVAIRGLVEPYTWTPRFSVSTHGNPPFGSYQLDGPTYQGESAAQGMEQKCFAIDNTALKLSPDGPIKARNMAVNLFPLADPRFIQDSRGFVIARDAEPGPGGISFRTAMIRGDAQRQRRLATAPKPFAVRKHTFWFRDLAFPADAWSFDGKKNYVESPANNEYAPGFDPDKIVESLHEWRFYDEPTAEEPSYSYSLHAGVFRFWPLRLLDVQVEDNGVLGALKILGRVDLYEPSAMDEVDQKDRPYGPDSASQQGNLVIWDVVKDRWSPYLPALKKLRFPKMLKCDKVLGTENLAVTLTYVMKNSMSPANASGLWSLEVSFAGTSISLAGELLPESERKQEGPAIPPSLLRFEGSFGFLAFTAFVDLRDQRLTLEPTLTLHTSDEPGSVPALRWSTGGFQWFGLRFDVSLKPAWSLDLITGAFIVQAGPWLTQGEVLPGLRIPASNIVASLQLLIAPDSGNALVVRALYGEVSSLPLSGGPLRAPRLVHRILVHSVTGGQTGRLLHDLRITGDVSYKSRIEWPGDVYPKKIDNTSITVEIQKEDYTWTHKFGVELRGHRYPVEQLRLAHASERLILTGEWRFDAVVRHTLQKTNTAATFDWRSVDQLRVLTGNTWANELKDFRNSIQSFLPLRKLSTYDYDYRAHKTRDRMRGSGSIAADLASSGPRDEWLLPEIEKYADQVFFLGGSLTAFDGKDGATWPLLWQYFGSGQVDGPVLQQRDLNSPAEWLASTGDLPHTLDVEDRDAPVIILPSEATEDDLLCLAEPAPPTPTAFEKWVSQPDEKHDNPPPTAQLIPEWVQQLFFQGANLPRLRGRRGRTHAVTVPVSSAPFFLGSLLTLTELRKLPSFIPRWSLRVSHQRAGYCARIRLPKENDAPTLRAEPPQLIVLSRKEGVRCTKISASEAEAKDPGRARIASLARATAVEPLAAFIRTSGATPTLNVQELPRPAFEEHTAPKDSLDPAAAPLIVASSALGWPAPENLERAAAMVPRVGDEGVFVSEAVGLAARAAATAWPAFGPGKSDVVQPAIYYNSHTAVVFQAQPLMPSFSGQAPRHLSPLPGRVRAPEDEVVSEMLAKHKAPGTALADVLPITAPSLERGVTGLRPGVFHVYGTSVTISGRNRTFDPVYREYGRPASRGPVLAHQLRAPRGTRLPDDYADDKLPFRRRTFLSEAELDKLFGKFEGVATVWRLNLREKKEKWRFTLSLDMGEKSSIHKDEVPQEAKDNALNASWSGQLHLKIDARSTPIQADLEAALRACHFDKYAATLHVGDQSFPFDRPGDNYTPSNKVLLRMTAFTSATNALAAATGNTAVYLEIQMPGEIQRPGKPSDPLPAGPPDFLRLPLQVVPMDRPVLDLSTTTIAFGDPSYDRQLGSSTQLVTRFANGLNYGLSLDRRQYEKTGMVFFAFGKIDVVTGLFDAAPPNWTIRFRRIPGKGGEPEQLTLGEQESLVKDSARPYSFSMTALQRNKAPLPWTSGDQLVIEASFTDSSGKVNLAVTVKIVDEPQIAPPPSVYSVVRAGNAFADVPLHASGPMPQRIEFPHLLDDLALGHVRRRALFIWYWTEVRQAGNVCLVKVDRSGGTQIPQL